MLDPTLKNLDIDNDGTQFLEDVEHLCSWVSELRT